MEKRKDNLSGSKVCRFCLSPDRPLSSIYEKSRTPKNSVTLPLKILSCISVEVFPSDKMPTLICNRCKLFMNLYYEYKQICRQADKNILHYIRNGTAMEPIVWPSSLVKTFRLAANMLQSKVVQTVVEGGATVEVTSQDMSDTEDEDNDVYNIKIQDSFEEGSKSEGALEITKEKPKKGQKESVEETAAVVTTDKPEGCFPCDECDCTYSLQQLLELHRKQKHRARTVQCNECDAKFFTKYDLATHQLRHLDEMPFQCIVCDKKFKRLILLKRHEKVVHSDLPQLLCPNCPATFLSQEELQAHQKRHVRPSQLHECTICHKKFNTRATLQRHKELIHGNKFNFVCKYCPERFSTVSKLAKHVRSHAGERAYPCKYCNKSFVKSHHYTRHLRVKHRQHANAPHETSTETEQYRCEQCDSAFGTQDELIYHSAIHTTQNLTCPLCQEKFENVDAVTAHIKSHVNGVEFMCDLCELVFTSKEKLDNHFIAAHEEEIQNAQVLDESSMEVDIENDEDGINVKEVGDDMIVEIKKAEDYMLTNRQNDAEEKVNTNSEESETETTYAELATVNTLSIIPPPTVTQDKATNHQVEATKSSHTKSEEKSNEASTASILRKVEEMKRKVQHTTETSNASAKKTKLDPKAETNNSIGASDKSLRLLEKELQDLKRTNSRNDVKMPVKNIEITRIRRPQLHTSTPKLKADEKKVQPLNKPSTIAVEKKPIERRVLTKENKEPKEGKSNNTSTKEEKDKEVKKDEKDTMIEKDPQKIIIKNEAGDKSVSEEGIRRSTRPSKIKDYAKMIRDSSQADDDDDSDADDEEYTESEKVENRGRGRRRNSVKAVPKSTPTVPAIASASAPATVSALTPTPVRKRGRPRKINKDILEKVKKDENEEGNESVTEEQSPSIKLNAENNKHDMEKAASIDQTKQDGAGLVVSPSGQTLKKVPIMSLPPGVRPLPLPTKARPLNPGELCEMQIGKKVVKVQKIVMTKAEVEAMAKKGLVEMKDGTMVLKQGIKLPTADPQALKSTLVGEELGKESPMKKEKGTPTRCNLPEDL